MVAPVVAAAPAVTSGIGTVVAGLGGSLLSGLFGRSSAKKSIAFQREMAKNAHQYEVADLRKAGLNPILSGTGGPGARASGGAMPPTPDFGGTAIAALRAKAEIENINANTNLTNTKEDVLSPKGEFMQDIDDLYTGLKKIYNSPNSGKALKNILENEMQKIKNLIDRGSGNVERGIGAIRNIKLEKWSK